MRKVILGILVLVAFVGSWQAKAAVYKWVDENGKVHFSDRPQDATKGEEVDVTSSNVMEGGNDLASSAEQNRQRVADQRKREQDQAARDEEDSFDPCAEDLESYEAYSRIHHDKNGRPFYYYENNEDGTPMSQREHNAMVESLEQSLRSRGCI